MKNSSRIAWLVSTSLLFTLLPVRQANSCLFWPDWEATRVMLFNPALSSDTGLQPFYFSRHFLYEMTRDPAGEDAARNAREWQSYLGAGVAAHDVDRVLNDDDPDYFLTAYAENRLAEAFPGNTFLKKLLLPQHRTALDYLAWAKQIEFTHAADDNPWYVGSYFQNVDTRDTVLFNRDRSLQVLAEQSREKIARAPDAFLRQRYAYQAVVCLRYTGQDSAAVATFDTHFQESDTTLLYAWGLLHKAECLPDAVQANYYLAQVFDRCQSKRIRVWNLFLTARTDSTLLLARTPAERATILTLNTMQYPGHALSRLQQIVAADPGCRYLPLLITREINKLEDWLQTQPRSGIEPRDIPSEVYDVLNEQTGYDDYQRLGDQWLAKNYRKDQAYGREFRDWLAQLERSNTLPGQRDFLRLALAHLYGMAGQPGSAAALLARISPQAPARYQAQKVLETILLTPLQEDVRRGAVQDQLAVQLRRLWKFRASLDRPERALAQLSLYLCHAFYQKHDVVSAGLLYNKANALLATEASAPYFSDYYVPLAFFDAHATVADLDRLLQLARQPKPTAFEQWMLEALPVPSAPDEGSSFYEQPYQAWGWEKGQPPPLLSPIQALLDLQGTLALRDGDLTRAHEIFCQLPDNYWQTTYEFQTWLGQDFIGSAQQLPFEPSTPTTASKAIFVERMLELEADARTHPAKRAENYYLLANGWYNCSYFGRGWLLFSYAQRYGEHDPYTAAQRSAVRFLPTPDRRKYEGVYYQLSRARAYYQRALDSRPDPELAAKAAFMLADCRYRVAELSSDDASPAKSDFQAWLRRYQPTATYAQVLTHCPELKDYLNQK